MKNETASFALGYQAAKGTGAANFVRGIFSSHRHLPAYNVLRAENEHRGLHERPSIHQTTAMRGDVIVPWSAAFLLRPYLVGYALLMTGYKVTTSTSVSVTLVGATGGTFTLTVKGQTTGNLAYNVAAGDIKTALELLTTVGTATVTGSAGGPYAVTVDAGVNSTTMTASGALLTGTTPTISLVNFANTHTFTEADADEIGYGSLLEYLGEGADRYGVRSVDAKASTLNFNATRGGIAVDMGGFAITPSDALGSEVETAEKDILLHPGTGSFTVTSAGITTLGTPRSHRWSIVNNLDDQEQELHSIYRAALTESGRSRTGTMGGLVFAEDIFREIAYAGGVSPVVTIPEAQLSWSYESPGAFAGATKYSLTWTFPNCELELTPFDISGASRLLYEASYTARDSVVGSPSTVVLVNDLASYAGS